MQIDEAIVKLRNLRRVYSQAILDALESENPEEYECEDLIRLVGHLQAAYDHLLASKERDNDLYCVLGKHLPAALILAGEIGEDVGQIYTILSLLSDGKIHPCSSCDLDKVS